MFDQQLFQSRCQCGHVEPIALVGSMTSRDGVVRDAGDAPNQQGQDAQHLPAIISFLVKRRPSGAQLILGVEEAVGIADNEARIVNVGVRKNSDAQFEAVSEQLRPYLAQLVKRGRSSLPGLLLENPLHDACADAELTADLEHSVTMGPQLQYTRFHRWLNATAS